MKLFKYTEDGHRDQYLNPSFITEVDFGIGGVTVKLRVSECDRWIDMSEEKGRELIKFMEVSDE